MDLVEQEISANLKRTGKTRVTYDSRLSLIAFIEEGIRRTEDRIVSILGQHETEEISDKRYLELADAMIHEFPRHFVPQYEVPGATGRRHW